MENEIREVGRAPMPQEWKPSKNECLREFEIKIRFLAMGCVIQVGCKEIPFTTIKEGMTALNHYIQSPYNVRQLWQERFSKEEEI